jgi:hypothetical protein
MEIDQWLKLVEYGDHPHRDGIQRVTKESAVEMQRKFRSLRARLARKFGGVPIYIGHPDDERFAHLPGHNDTRSYAWVQDIEAREDGIWILPKWSEDGRKLIENSYFKFLSPRWEMKSEGGALIPIRLISVGLTNHPNILGDAIANQEIIVGDREWAEEPSAAAAMAKDGAPEMEGKGRKRIRKSREKVATQNATDPRDSQLLQRVDHLLMQLFSVDLGQSIGEIEGRLTAVAEQARLWREEGETLRDSNGELTSESERFYRIACEKERQVKALTEQLGIEKDRSGEHFVNFAVSRGLILPNESMEWKEKYIADPNGASNELLKRTCVLNTTSKTDHLREQMHPNGKAQILALVNERMESNGEDYREAWMAIKQLYPALF